MKSPTGDKFTLTEDTEPPSTPRKVNPRDKTSNNHHVVPLGILAVLCTVYLMAAGVQRNYRYYMRPGVAAFDLPALDLPPLADESMEEELEASSCQQMDIFERESDQKSASLNLISKRTPGKALKRTKSGTGNGLVVSKQPRLAKSAESGGQKKKEAAAKKSNTAEPIIYLFALVFIYLLLKAASDINQHYKSNKGDKRLRRCSLQSYAQIHKQDRRASKVPEESPIFRRRHILGEVRSVSVDRYKYSLNEDYHHHRVASPLANRPGIQHHHQQQLPFRPGPGDTRFEPRMNRRSSVPISINYQTVHVSSPYPPPPAELARRGSVISLTGPMPDASAGALSSGTLVDPKRRVRMINRH